MTVTVKHPFVSTVPDDADTSLVRPSNWNADHTIIGLGTAAEKDVGVANGVASLDGTGKVPISELPSAVIGALNYQGTWNASTNTPTLTSSVGTKGYYYVVNVAGTTNLNGITDWQVGDWAVFNGTVWEKVDNTDAGGDVVGPTSATDNAIARYDGTTGRVIQNSVVTVSDTGGIAGATNITDINYVDFNTAYATTLGAGQLGWDGNNTLGLGMSGGNVVQEIGLQSYIYGKATSAITKGQLIKKTGANGSSGVITFAPTTANMTNSGDVIGIAAENIALNGFGYITSVGNLRGFDTTGSSAGETWADGDTLYYNPAGNGLMTKTKPSAPNIKTEVAVVTNAGSGGSGSVVVEVIHGSVLGGTDSNVQINGVTGGQLLSYDQTNGYWKNTNLAAGTGISVNSATGGTITVTNSAPDQTVAIASGTGISVTGTYPNFTVTNTSPSSGGTVTSITAGTGLTGGTITTSGTIAIDSTVATLTGSQTLTNKTISGASNTLTNIGNSSLTNSAITINGTSTSLGGSINVGTVTSVTGTAPISVATGTTTPAISISQANSTTNGFLSSTDWNTFNNKGSGTVTSVGGTGTVNGITLSGTVTSSGNLTLGGTLSNVSLSTQVTGTLPIANGGTGQTTANAAYNALSPMTTAGDLTYEAAGGIATRLPIGSAGQVLTVSSGIPAWASLPAASTTITNDTTTATALYPTFTSSTGTAITGLSVTSTKLTFVPSTGALSSTSHVSSSDARFKDNVQPITNALDKVNQLLGVSYVRNDIKDKSRQIGFIAQDVEKIIPEVVMTDENGYKLIAYSNMISLLVEAVKELTLEVKKLKNNQFE